MPAKALVGEYRWVSDSTSYSVSVYSVSAVRHPLTKSRTVAVMIGVSYATEEPDYEAISGLTYATLSDSDRIESRGTWDRLDVIGSATVIVMIALAYVYFSG